MASQIYRFAAITVDERIPEPIAADDVHRWPVRLSQSLVLATDYIDRRFEHQS